MNLLRRLFSRRPAAMAGDGLYTDWVDDAALAPARAPGTEAGENALPGFAISANRIDQRGGISSGDMRWTAMRRAFKPSQPVQDIMLFAGRSDLLRRVIRAIEDQNLHVIVYGDRGIGKTSLMKTVSELATRAHYVVSYTSCGEDSDFTTTMRAIAARVPLLYHRDFDPASDEVVRGGTLADRLPEGGFTVAELSDLLGKIEGTRLLMIIDEFDRIESARFRGSIAELIKNLSDRSIEVQLLIGGVAANLSELIAHVPSIRRNIIGVTIPNMTDEEIRELIRIGSEAGGARFDDAATARIVAGSAGLPYLASLIGQHATIRAAEEHAEVVTAEHVAAGIERAAEDIGSRLSPAATHALAQDGVLASGSSIVEAAREAVAGGGTIQSQALTQRLADGTAPTSGLLEAIDGDPFGHWRFREDGVASYVWLCSVRDGVAPPASA